MRPGRRRHRPTWRRRRLRLALLCRQRQCNGRSFVPRFPDLSHASGVALDLSDEQKLALVALLTRTINDDRHPSSSRVRALKDILVKLDAKSPAQPYLAPNAYAPRDETRTRTLHRG